MRYRVGEDGEMDDGGDEAPEDEPEDEPYDFDSDDEGSE
jgi:hypothetical protein